MPKITNEIEEIKEKTVKTTKKTATKSAAKELANSHIRVNAIAPGMVGTERFKAVLEEKFSQKINDIP